MLGPCSGAPVLERLAELSRQRATVHRLSGGGSLPSCLDQPEKGESNEFQEAICRHPGVAGCARRAARPFGLTGLLRHGWAGGPPLRLDRASQTWVGGWPTPST